MSKIQSIVISAWRWLFGGIGRIRHEYWEIWMMRAGLAWFMWQGTPAAMLPKGQPKPHGIAQFMDVTFISQPGVYGPLYSILLVALVCYALGLAVSLCLGYMLAFVVLIYTLGLSQGYVGHSAQMGGLVLLAQFSATVWAFASGRLRAGTRSDLRQYRDDLMMCWTRQAIVATYVVAGITKLINSEGEWLNRSGYFVLQVLKAQSEAYYSSGNHANPTSMAFLSALSEWPYLAAVFLAFGLLLELGAFLAAWNRSLGLVIGIMLIVFHVTLGTLMYLPFYESRGFVMLFLVNPAWWAFIGFKLVKGRFRNNSG